MSTDGADLSAAQRVAGVVFVPANPAPADAHRLYDTGRPDVAHVSTDYRERKPHIRRALVEHIARARHKILFCSFLFADEEIVQALCEAAARMHGGVYVLTVLDKHLQAQVHEPDTDADAAKFEERRRRHIDHLQRLAESGAWLRSAEDCHAKFCVIDDAVGVVTSANSTREAYESNPEDGLVVRHRETACELGRLFAHIWQHLSAHDSTPGTLLDVHSLPQRAPPPWRALSDTGAVSVVATMRSYEASLQQAAVEIIDAARARIAIATYSFMGMEDHPIGLALRNAVARGVEIDVLVQPRNRIVAQRMTCKWFLGLAPGRTRLHGHCRTHTKSIIADDRCGLLWTGNLEAAHGWDNGIEVGLSIKDAGVASAIARWSAAVMQHATDRPLLEPTTAELKRLGVRIESRRQHR